jgi:hypothetical protein
MSFHLPPLHPATSASSSQSTGNGTSPRNETNPLLSQVVVEPAQSSKPTPSPLVIDPLKNSLRKANIYLSVFRKSRNLARQSSIVIHDDPGGLQASPLEKAAKELSNFPASEDAIATKNECQQAIQELEPEITGIMREIENIVQIRKLYPKINSSNLLDEFYSQVVQHLAALSKLPRWRLCDELIQEYHGLVIEEANQVLASFDQRLGKDNDNLMFDLSRRLDFLKKIHGIPAIRDLRVHYLLKRAEVPLREYYQWDADRSIKMDLQVVESSLSHSLKGLRAISNPPLEVQERIEECSNILKHLSKLSSQ